jgi:hypothetical protein
MDGRRNILIPFASGLKDSIEKVSGLKGKSYEVPNADGRRQTDEKKVKNHFFIDKKS